MRKIFFLLSIICFAIGTNAQTYTSGLTATGSGTSTDVRLGGANPLLVNTTVDLGTFSFGFKKLSADYFTILNNGDIGIGNVSPSYKLDVSGTARFTGNVSVNSALEITDHLKFGGALLPNNSAGTIGQVLTSSGPGLVPTWTTLATPFSGWGLTGNAGTNTTTNFIGTTDNQPLSFRINGLKKGLLDATSFSFGDLSGAVSAGWNKIDAQGITFQINGTSVNVLKFEQGKFTPYTGGTGTTLASIKANSLNATLISSGNIATQYESLTLSGNAYPGVQASLILSNTYSSDPHRIIIYGGSSASQPVSILKSGDGNLIVGGSNSSDIASAQLNVISTTKGALLPRMTSIQREAIATPASGLLVFDTNVGSLFQFNGSVWQNLYSATGAASQWATSGSDISFTSGNVGIGTTQTSDIEYKLFVEKGIKTRKIKVDADALVWADYVFDQEYKLLSLSEVDKFIQQNRHLPGVLSSKEVQKNGIDLGENQAVLLKKIEELTLYIIDLNNKLKEQQNEIDNLKHR